jgi:hypothetical protein
LTSGRLCLFAGGKEQFMTVTRWSLCLVVGLATAAAAHASDLRGVIAGVDPDKKELTLEGRGPGLRGRALCVHFNSDLRVMFGDQPGAVSDLTPGRRVRVEVQERDGETTVLVVHVLGGRPATAPTPSPAADGDLTGILQRVSPSEREIVVVGPGPKGADTETTVTVPDDAKILSGEKSLTFDDLKEGQQASLRLQRRDGRVSAASIQVGPGGPAPADKPRPLTRLRRLLPIADEVLKQMDRSPSGPDR